MEDKDRDKYYSTSDTALAAWLYSCGYDLAEVDNSIFPSVFHFLNENDSLKEQARAYNIGKAEGNIFAFYKSYKTMLQKIRAGR